MARAVFLVLVFANLVFFVWASNYLGVEDEGHEPGRVKAQLQADRLIVAVRDANAPMQACRRVGPLALADAERLKVALGARSGIAVVLNPVPENGFWVFIPPLADKAATEKKATELKRMGIDDFFIVGEPGPYHNAISLGSFSNEETAKDLYDRLIKKGVRSARVEPRQRPAEKASIDVRGEAALVARGLADLLPAADCAD